MRDFRHNERPAQLPSHSVCLVATAWMLASWRQPPGSGRLPGGSQEEMGCRVLATRPRYGALRGRKENHAIPVATASHREIAGGQTGDSRPKAVPVAPSY